MLKIRMYWSKYKGLVVGIIIIMLLALLVINTILLRTAQKKNDEQAVAMELVKEMVETNKRILDENKKVIEEFEKQNKENKQVVVTKTSYYEATKASPINVNYTNAELLKWLKSYESKTDKRGTGGTDNTSKSKNPSSVKR